MDKVRVTITGYLEGATPEELAEYENDLFSDELVGEYLTEVQITFQQVQEQ